MRIGKGTGRVAVRDPYAALAAAQEDAARLREQLRKKTDALAALRAEDAELLAYARATVAAGWQGSAEALTILTGLLEERGQLPARDARPAALLALGYREATS